MPAPVLAAIESRAMEFLLWCWMLGQRQPPVRIFNPTNPNPMPGDVRMQQFDLAEGAMWRVFSVDANPHGPVKVIKLKPQQVIRRESPVRVTVIAPTDRVVFYVREIKSETGDWKSVDADVAALIASIAAQLPVP